MNHTTWTKITAIFKDIVLKTKNKKTDNTLSLLFYSCLARRSIVTILLLPIPPTTSTAHVLQIVNLLLALMDVAGLSRALGPRRPSAHIPRSELRHPIHLLKIVNPLSAPMDIAGLSRDFDRSAAIRPHPSSSLHPIHPLTRLVFRRRQKI